jgi:hypothetical protein
VFITYQELQARRDAKAAAIDVLKAAVADKDPNPLIPGEQYTGGDMFDGFSSVTGGAARFPETVAGRGSAATEYEYFGARRTAGDPSQFAL